VLRRIPRIICPDCGRARVTTLAGWHLCPSPAHDHAHAQASGALWLTGLVALIGVMLWVLWRFWP
jgi:hypothetical protein